MSELKQIFGTGPELTVWQMSLRAIVVFILGVIIIRISGRRSFGIRMPIDNVTAILLGAILARAVVGVSPFVPTIVAAVIFAVLHRMFAWLAVHNSYVGRLVKGKELVLYENGELNRKNMQKALVSERDLLEGMRITASIGSLSEAEIIYMERDGQISVVRKKT